jgi:hypothetical protein
LEDANIRWPRRMMVSQGQTGEAEAGCNGPGRQNPLANPSHVSFCFFSIILNRRTKSGYINRTSI